MNIADLVRGPRPESRRVGIHFPDRYYVVAAAKKLYLDLGVACELEHETIYVTVPHVAAQWYLGLLERATGHIGFNDWDNT